MVNGKEPDNKTRSDIKRGDNFRVSDYDILFYILLWTISHKIQQLCSSCEHLRVPSCAILFPVCFFFVLLLDPL